MWYLLNQCNSAYLALHGNLFINLALISEHHVTAVQRQKEVLHLSSSYPHDKTFGVYRP